MANPLTRIVGVYTSDGTTLFSIERTDIASTDDNIALAVQDYFASGDGTTPPTADADEAASLQAAIIAASVNNANFTVSVDVATGIYTFDCGAGETYTITWVDTDYRDRLRFSGATTAVTDAGISGSRAHRFGVYPQLGIAEDDRVVIHRASQSRADSGIVDTVSYGSWEEHRLTLQYQGPPRATIAKEYHDVLDFMAHANQGKRFRLYPDRSDSTGVGGTDAFVEFTTPWGYTTHVLRTRNWTPTPRFGSWPEWFLDGLELMKYVAP
jgi:hypothetical protein